MSKVFTELGYKWKPTGKLFTLVGNSCPLTRFTLANLVPPKETTYHSVETPKPEIKVYIRRPKQIKTAGSSKKAKIVESKIANNSEPNHSWGSNAIDVPSSSSLVNDSWALSTISRVYYVEGLRHNLFSVRQFCDLDLEVAFWKNTCFIQNLDGVELFSSFKDSNLYTISLDDMLKTSLICRKAHLLEDKQIPSVGYLKRFLALGWHLEEIHVTWAHLEKKRTRLGTCTKIHQEVLFSEHGDGVASIK
ncbi:hypothetical protein Tco_1063245 [Tanacetum coccineum]